MPISCGSCSCWLSRPRVGPLVGFPLNNKKRNSTGNSKATWWVGMVLKIPGQLFLSHIIHVRRSRTLLKKHMQLYLRSKIWPPYLAPHVGGIPVGRNGAICNRPHCSRAQETTQTAWTWCPLPWVSPLESAQDYQSFLLSTWPPSYCDWQLGQRAQRACSFPETDWKLPC